MLELVSHMLSLLHVPHIGHEVFATSSFVQSVESQHNGDDSGQAEYLVGMSISRPADGEGVSSVDTGSGQSVPTLKIFGSKGVTDDILLIPDMKSGRFYQLSLVGAAVGKIKGIELQNRMGNPNWTLGSITVSDMSGAKDPREIIVNRPISVRTYIPFEKMGLS